jgi:cytochrome c-type biogenesis protein CcmH
MAARPETRRRLSPATLILILAALAAAGSVGFSLLRGSGRASAEDPRAADWRMVGWAYAEKGDGAASAAAYRKAAALEPGNAENWSSLGEALQSASTKIVPEAASAFRKAIELDPSDPRARYFLAVQKDLGGDHTGAIADWAALLKDTPPGAPWQADLERAIRQTAERYGIEMPAPGAAQAPAATAGIPGPTAGQLAAASSIPPGEQDAMARTMVDRLARRLQGNPRDADGWIRLMRSRAVLNDPAGASRALQSGLAAFADDAAAQGRLRSAAAQLGLAGGG